jgi:hypothetical protein
MGRANGVTVLHMAAFVLGSGMRSVHGELSTPVHFERRELALDVLNLNNWQACLAKFSEWELAIENGELVEVSTDDDETALAADLST